MDDRRWFFVKSYEKRKEGKGHSYDVFNAEGIYVASVFFAARASAIKGSKVCTIKDDKGGNPLVKRYSLEWN